MEHKNHRGRASREKFDSTPPCDIDAERAVLAVVLLEPRQISDVAAALEPADFADEAHRTIYAAMLRLQRRGLLRSGLFRCARD
jgi:replicative DNA helicase